MTRLCKLEGSDVSEEVLERVIGEVISRLESVYSSVLYIKQNKRVEFLVIADKEFNYLHKTRSLLDASRYLYHSNTDIYLYEYYSGKDRVIICLYLVNEYDKDFAQWYVSNIDLSRQLSDMLQEYGLSLTLTGLYLDYYTRDGQVSHIKQRGWKRHRLCLSRDYRKVESFLSQSRNSFRDRALQEFGLTETYQELVSEIVFRNQFNRLVKPRKLAQYLNLHGKELGRVLTKVRDLYRIDRTLDLSEELILKVASREIGTSSAAERHHIELNSPVLS